MAVNCVEELVDVIEAERAAGVPEELSVIDPQLVQQQTTQAAATQGLLEQQRQGATVGRGLGSAAGAGFSSELHALKQVTKQLKQVAAAMKRSSSASQSASNISQSQVHEIRQALRVVVAPVPTDPTLTDLFKSSPAEAQAAQADVGWDDEVMEDRQGKAAMDEIKEKIGRVSPLSSSSSRPQVRWFSARGITLTRRFGEMSYSIKGENDEVLGVTCFGDVATGAVLGVEVKTKLSVQGLRQAETEFYLWQSSSQYPFCQVITDMKIGCAYFFEAVNQEGYLVLRYRVFGSMEPLYEFMATLINGLPSDLNDQLRPRTPSSPPVSFPQEFSEPQRVKPQRVPYAGRSAGLPPFATAFKLISEMRDAEEDIANLRDLADWPN